MLEFTLSLLAAVRVFFRCRSDIALEVLALRQQLAVFKRKRPRPNLNSPDRLFWTIVVLGNLLLTCDRTDSTASLVFERASSDFTRPMLSARNASGRFAKSLVAAAAVSVNEAAQGTDHVRMESRRRCL